MKARYQRMCTVLTFGSFGAALLLWNASGAGANVGKALLIALGWYGAFCLMRSDSVR